MSELSITRGFSRAHQEFLAHTSDNVTSTAACGLQDGADWRRYLGKLLDHAQTNLQNAVARGQRAPSSKTWLLRSATDHDADNDRPETLLEKRIVQLDAGWFNQVPVASGLTDPHADRNRRVDLAYHFVDRQHLELVELKVDSNNPLAATIELLEYVCIYLLCRRQREQLGLAERPALSVSSVRALVLAPARYYARHGDITDKLRRHQPTINEALRSLLTPQDPTSVEFAVCRFPAAFEWDPNVTTSQALAAALRGIEPV